MLSRKLLIAAAVVLLSFGMFNQARAEFQPGDFITYSQVNWGDATQLGGITLNAHYDSVYPSGLVEVGIPGAGGYSIILTNSGAVFDCLPTSGPAAPLNADPVDPTSTASGIFGGEVTKLPFNVDLSDAGYTLGSSGIPFGDLVIHSYTQIPQANGLTVRQGFAQAEMLLGGGTVGYAPAQANQLLIDVNGSFSGGEPSPWAQEHLRIPGDFNGDLKVDAADYVVWRKTDGTAAGYNEWPANFGWMAGSGSGAAVSATGSVIAAVPEPTALALFLVSSLYLGCRRPRRT